MSWLNDVLAISPRLVGFIGASAIVGLVVLDLIAGLDEVEWNTPRELVIKLTQWGGGRFSGAWVPFGLGALLGHFFHPWSQPPFTSSWLGTGLVLGLAIVCGFAMPRGSSEPKRGGAIVFYVVVLGIAAGALLWPVGPFD